MEALLKQAATGIFDQIRLSTNVNNSHYQFRAVLLRRDLNEIQAERQLSMRMPGYSVTVVERHDGTFDLKIRKQE